MSAIEVFKKGINLMEDIKINHFCGITKKEFKEALLALEQKEKFLAYLEEERDNENWLVFDVVEKFFKEEGVSK